MKLLERVARIFGYGPLEGRRDSRRLSAKYDAASTDTETRRHWSQADGFSADAAADPATRYTLRIRGRHEQFNNAYVYGPLHTLANDIIGVGPSLQMLTDNERVNQAVEERFGEWAEAVGLAETLRLMRRTRAAAGEVFCLLVRNPGVKDPVKLGLRLLEADQVATPSLLTRDNDVDGIEFDGDLNPIFYHVLKRHPGDVTKITASPLDFVRVPAENVIHYFRQERPGQSRGVPELVSSLNLHAERRGYRQAVLAAARRIAQLGAVLLETEADGDTSDTPEPFEEIEIANGMITTLPAGAKGHQVKPEQPGTTYGEFDDRNISEQARPLNMPYGIAAGNSSKYNFASVRFDAQVFDRANEIDRAELARLVLRPIFQRWAILATAVQNHLPRRAGQVYLPTALDPYFMPKYKWHWRDREHVDPSKAANAQDTKLANFATTLADEYARERKDWRVEIDQAGRELLAKDAAGIASIDPQFAPHVIKMLQQVTTLGVDVVAEALTLMKVASPKARRLAVAAEQALAKVGVAEAEPAADEDPMPPAVAARVNGNGVQHV